MSAPEHHPAGGAGWLVAAITGAFSLLRSLVSRRESTQAQVEEELDSAASRGAHRATILVRLAEAESQVERLVATVDRLEQALDDFRAKMHRELEDIMHALHMRNS